ncbi:MAG: hypothetical protein J6L90_03345 [Clostridia bacterium]|nr:hypothetical protein [Clostridia bacterium]
MTKAKRHLKWLLPVMFFLLFASVVALPLLANITFANRADAPVHILNYETGSLMWAEGTPDIDEDGVCHLSLFDSLPKDENGDKLISPGDEDKTVLRLMNRTGNKVFFKAVLYKVSVHGIPIEADFSNFEGVKDEHIYNLPDGVKKSDVIRVVGGELSAYKAQDFDIEWVWKFDVDEEADKFDTYLANLERADVTLGVYITVTDNVELEPIPEDINVDTNGDGIPDLNIDTDKDGEAEINIDTNRDEIPDINIDITGDNRPELNIDLNGDGAPDFNFDTNDDKIPDKHVITIPDKNAIVTPPADSWDKIFDRFDAESYKDLTLKLDNLGGYVEGVQIDRNELAEFVARGGMLRFVFTNFKVEFDNKALVKIVSEAVTDTVHVVAKEILKEELSATQLNALAGKQVALTARAYVYSGTKVISEFDEGRATLYVPFTKHNKTVIRDYKVYHITDEGGLERMEDVYDEDSHCFIYTVEHFSEYVIIYEGDRDIGVLPPEPHVCTCVICLFGGECTSCALCWAFVLMLGMLVIVGTVLVIWRKFE